MMNNIQISVVVATLNRAGLLVRLLNGLSSQIKAPPFEVIIGDNGSTDDTPSVVENARASLRIHFVREEHPGKSRALNTALKSAQGQLIVFTDDDVRPDPDWLAQFYAASLRYPKANIFGGLIEVNLEDIPDWIRKSYNLMGLLTSAHHFGPQDVIYPYGQYPFGPNMAIRRHLLEGFDAPYPDNLGPGTKYPVGDETAFFIQFSLPGALDRVFIPAAKVYHQVEAQNMIFRNLLRRCYISGRGYNNMKWMESNSHPGPYPSTLALILSRIGSCRSVQELICITARYMGYLIAKCQKS